MPDSSLRAEIYSQPDCWSLAADESGRYADRLPVPGERVGVIGCGTSLFIARAYSFLREQAGQGVTDAWPASQARLRRDYDRIIALTRSGTTTEILTALDQYRATGGTARVTVITATPDTPAQARGDSITLAEFDETSVVQTRFATSTLSLLRAHLGEDLTAPITQAKEILAAPGAEQERSLAGVRSAGQITFVGMGLGAALAEEAALKLREATQSWAESYPATEYRHGPISIAQPGRAVWSLGPLVPGFAEDIAATGAHLERHDTDPQAELVRVHLLCLLRAADLGLRPASPRNLTRAVILS